MLYTFKKLFKITDPLEDGYSEGPDKYNSDTKIRN